MRFLIFVSYFLPHRGGQENYFYYLGKELVRKGHTVDIVTNNTENSKAVDKIEGLNIYRVKCRHLLNGTYPVPCRFDFNKVMKKLSSKNYNVAVTSTRFYVLSLYGNRWSRKNNIKTLHIEHGTRHSAVSNPLVSLINQIFDHTIGRYIIKNSWKVVGVSEAAKKFVKHLYSRNTGVLYNSVDTSYFRPVKTTLKKRLKISKEKVITFIGRLTYAKGVQDLIEATKDLKGIKVLIVGDGDYRKELEKMAHQNVIFLGEKDAKELRDILSITDIFVNPSYSEGLPTCVLEAGSMGLSVIATDVGGTREIINKDTGILIQPNSPSEINEKIIKILAKKNTMGSKLRKTVENKFSWKNNTREFIRLIK